MLETAYASDATANPERGSAKAKKDGACAISRKGPVQGTPQRLVEPRLPYARERVGIIVGMLLGDGHIPKRSRNHITFSHSAKQAEYLAWKLKVLQALGFRTTEPKRYAVKNHQNGKTYQTVRASAYAPDVPWFYEKLYGGGKKHVSTGMLRHVTPYGLAVWYMDDGGLAGKAGNIAGTKLHTSSFTEKEHELMSLWFKKKYGIRPKIHSSLGYLRLYFGTSDNAERRFHAMVRPYIHPSMGYKIRRESGKTPRLR